MTSTVFTDIDWDKNGKQIGTLNLPHSPDDDAWGVIPFPAASIKNGNGPVAVSYTHLTLPKKRIV